MLRQRRGRKAVREGLPGHTAGLRQADPLGAPGVDPVTNSRGVGEYRGFEGLYYGGCADIAIALPCLHASKASWCEAQKALSGQGGTLTGDAAQTPATPALPSAADGDQDGTAQGPASAATTATDVDNGNHVAAAAATPATGLGRGKRGPKAKGVMGPPTAPPLTSSKTPGPLSKWPVHIDCGWPSACLPNLSVGHTLRCLKPRLSTVVLLTSSHIAFVFCYLRRPYAGMQTPHRALIPDNYYDLMQPCRPHMLPSF
eukprot:scaffold83827_cov21-Tisochrysis_lutea.AAC.1